MKEVEVIFTAPTFTDLTGHVNGEQQQAQIKAIIADAIPEHWYQSVFEAYGGKSVRLSAKRGGERAKQRQYGYFFAVVLPMITAGVIEVTGEQVHEDEVREMLKMKFWSLYKINESTGEETMRIPRSMAGMKTWEMALFTDQCSKWALEYLDILIPPPEKYRDQYTFMELPMEGESRDEYMVRIIKELQTIPDTASLKRFFALVPEWAADAEIKMLFRDRYDVLAAAAKKM